MGQIGDYELMKGQMDSVPKVKQVKRIYTQ